MSTYRTAQAKWSAAHNDYDSRVHLDSAVSTWRTSPSTRDIADFAAEAFLPASRRHVSSSGSVDRHRHEGPQDRRELHGQRRPTNHAKRLV